MVRFADFEVNGERLPAEFFLDWAKVSLARVAEYVVQARAYMPPAVYFRLQKMRRSISVC